MELQTGSIGSFAEKIKLFSGPGTRQWTRFDISDVPAIKGIRSKTGSAINVANISRGGALLRTRKRLARATRVQLNLAIEEGVIQLTGLVLRSSIYSPKGMPRFQAAVAFDRPLEILGSQPKPMPDTLQAPVPKFPPFDMFCSDNCESLCSPILNGDSSAIADFFAAGVCDVQDAALHEMFRLNDW
jgi:hypothetical protein